jgi:translation elongation factor EF-G
MSSDRRGPNTKSSTAKSMNTLRQLLQESINEEIDEIMQRYIKQYIEPAADNIEMNQRIGVIATNGIPPKQCIKTICRQILEEAKKMY